MKIIVLIVCVSVVCARASDFYVFSPNNLTPDILRQNPETIKTRLDCFLGIAPCTDVTAELKKIGKEVVVTACARCPPTLKDLIRAFLEVAQEQYPVEYNKLRVMYDPVGSNFDRLEAAVGF